MGSSSQGWSGETRGLAPNGSEAAGIASAIEGRLDKSIADKRVWNLHGLVVLLNDQLLVKRYFEAEDRARGVGAIGHVVFKTDTLNDLRSCSKSVVGLL